MSLALLGIVFAQEGKTQEKGLGLEISPKTILFYADHKIVTLPLASPQCQALLDDTSNFEVQTTIDRLEIRAKQQNNQGALLIVSCPAGDSYYNLTYTNRIEQMALEQPLDGATLSDPSAFLEWNVKAGSTPYDRKLGFRARDASDQSLTMEASSLWQISDPQGSNQDFSLTSVPLPDLSLQIGAGQQTFNGIPRHRERAGASWHGFGGVVERSLTKNDPSRLDIQLFTVQPIPITYAGTEVKGERRSRRVSTYGYLSLLDVQDRIEVYRMLEEELVGGSSVDVLGLNNYVRHRLLSIGSMKHQLGVQCTHVHSCRIPTLDSGLAIPYGNGYIGLQYEYLTQIARGELQWAFYPRQRFDVTLNHAFKSAAGPRNDRFATEDEPSDSNPFRRVDGSATLHLEAGYKPVIYGNLSRSFSKGGTFSTPLLQVGAIWQTRPLRLMGTYQTYLSAAQRRDSLAVTLQWELGGGVRHVFDYFKNKKITGKIKSSIDDKPLSEAIVTCVDEQGKVLASGKTNAAGVFLLESIQWTSCESIGVHSGEVSKKFSAAELNGATMEMAFPDRSVVHFSFYIDKNENGEWDAQDSLVQLENYIEEIGEALIQVDQGVFVRGILTVPRQRKIDFKVTPQYLPAGYKSVKLSPESIDTITNESQDVRVLLLRK